MAGPCDRASAKEGLVNGGTSATDTEEAKWSPFQRTMSTLGGT